MMKIDYNTDGTLIRIVDRNARQVERRILHENQTFLNHQLLKPSNPPYPFYKRYLTLELFVNNELYQGKEGVVCLLITKERYLQP
jgi:hypothetical protein